MPLKTRTTPTGRTLALVMGGRPTARTEPPTRPEYLSAALTYATRQLSAEIAAENVEDFLVIKVSAGPDGNSEANVFTTSEDAAVIALAMLVLQRYGLNALGDPAEEDDGD